MISVAYDITALTESPFGGIAQVCHHTLEQARDHDDIEPCAVYRRGDPGNVSVENVTVRKVNWLDRLCLQKYDIVHALNHRIPPTRCGRLVYTLYDAWSLYPNKYQSPDFQGKIGMRMRGDLLQADAIVCISEATRSKLLELNLVGPERCHVALMGVVAPEEGAEAAVGEEVRRLAARPFVLFVGRIETRKNLAHVIDAVKPLSGLNLIVVGEPGYGYEQIAQSILPRFPDDRLHVLKHLTEADLDWLYRHALAALLPSWEEGFGLPLLEAMARGCPVITSNVSASAEVADSGAVLVDPDNPSESCDTLARFLDDKPFRKEMVRAGLERSRQFSWQTYYQRLIDLYTNLLGRD